MPSCPHTNTHTHTSPHTDTTTRPSLGGIASCQKLDANSGATWSSNTRSTLALTGATTSSSPSIIERAATASLEQNGRNLTLEKSRWL